MTIPRCCEDLTGASALALDKGRSPRLSRRWCSLLSGVLLSHLLVATTAMAVPCAPSGCPEIEVGSATGTRGETVTVAVTLRAKGNQVSAVNVLMTFAEEDFGTPDPTCEIGVSVPSDKTFLFANLFEGQLSFNLFGTSTPISDGSILATCSFVIGASASSGTLVNVDPETTDVSMIPREYDATVPIDGRIEVLGIGTPTRTPGGSCLGDCDGNGLVRLDELIVGVNIAVDTLPITACPVYGDQVRIEQLVVSVGHALSGCP